MALGSIKPLTEMSTWTFPGVKSGRWVRLTTLPPFCGVVMNSVNLNFLEPSWPLQACNFNSPHSVRLEVVFGRSIESLCSWWQNTQFDMKYILHIARFQALILQVWLCVWVNNIVVFLRVLCSALKNLNYDPPELGQFMITTFSWWAPGGALDWGTTLQAGRSQVRFPMVSLEFFIDIVLPAILCSWDWRSL